MTVTPFLRWAWGLVIASLFSWSWLVLWGLMPGTPAADEVAVDADVRFSLEREADGPLAGVLPGFAQVRQRDIAQAGNLTIREDGDWSVLQSATNVRRLRINPAPGESYPAITLHDLPQNRNLEALSMSYTGL